VLPWTPPVHRVLLPTITARGLAARRRTFTQHWGGEKPRRNAKYAYLRAALLPRPRPGWPCHIGPQVTYSPVSVIGSAG